MQEDKFKHIHAFAPQSWTHLEMDSSRGRETPRHTRDMSRRGAEQMEAGFDCSVDLWPQGEKVPKGLRKENTLLCRYTYIQTLFFYTHTSFSILQESLAAYCVEVRVTTSWLHFDVEKGRMQLSQSIIGWLQQLNVIIWIMDQVVWHWRLVKLVTGKTDLLVASYSH